MLSSQEPTKKQLKKKQPVTDTVATYNPYAVDTLLIEQKEMKLKMDSLYNEKLKKK